MFALLGTIQFKLITYFDGIEVNKATKFARHEVLDGKPILQRTGDELDEISIELAFHDYYCDPATELKRLDDARLAAEAMPLIWGNGVVEGQFVIEKLRVTGQTATRFGELTSVSASVSLIEYVEPQLPVEAARARKKQKAPARKKGSKKKPVGTKVARAVTITKKNPDGIEYTTTTRN